jgi:hypothetical protein
MQIELHYRSDWCYNKQALKQIILQKGRTALHEAVSKDIGAEVGAQTAKYLLVEAETKADVKQATDVRKSAFSEQHCIQLLHFNS